MEWSEICRRMLMRDRPPKIRAERDHEVYASRRNLWGTQVTERGKRPLCRDVALQIQFEEIVGMGTLGENTVLWSNHGNCTSENRW